MEALLRVADKVSPDFYLNCQCTKRGDVIVVREDGWRWGGVELTAPFWRIIRHTGISVAEASSLLAPEPEIDAVTPSATRQRRAFKWQVDAVVLPAVVKDFLADNTRAVPVFDLTPHVTAAQFATLKTARVPIADPRIIG